MIHGILDLRRIRMNIQHAAESNSGGLRAQEFILSQTWEK